MVGKPILTVTLNAAIDLTLTIPSLEAGRSYTADSALRLAGGKGLNVARTLHRLCIPVRATGLAGGSVGAFIPGALDGEGIAHDFQPIAASSRICTAVVELDKRRVTEVNEPGPAIDAGEGTTFLSSFARSAREAALVVLSGSLPPGLPDDYYAALLARAHEAGVPTILDTSKRALPPALTARPLLVKPNADEAALFIGRPARSVHDAAAAGEAARRQGARLAVTTLGAIGAVLVSDVGAWRAHVDVPDPLSTVGCGDAFVGGFVAALYRAAEASAGGDIDVVSGRAEVLVDALALATACAAANTRMLGAGRMREDDVDSFRRAAVVEPVA